MAKLILLNPAPPWLPTRKDELNLWHGCTSDDADAIYLNGIDLSKCKCDTDFGRGFYLTSILRQAKHWAWLRVYNNSLPNRATVRPVTMHFVLKRSEIGDLCSMRFVSGQYDHEDFWSLVQHCRQSPPTPNEHRHEHPSPDRWYDVVSGPVTSFWPQRAAMVDSDQTSFHTEAAIKPLNGYIRRKRAVGNKRWIEDVV